PFLTPLLPDNRLQIVYFYFSILFSLFLWRIAYLTFIISPRFYKKVLIIGEIYNIKAIIEAFKECDTNYKIVGFISCEGKKADNIKYNGMIEYIPKLIYQDIKD